jgi:hypothetical protein
MLAVFMGTWVFCSLLAALLLATAPSAVAAEPTDGTYTHQWIYYENADLSKKVTGTDKLDIHKIDENSFDFDASVTGANYHTCSLAGVAKRQGLMFEYRKLLEPHCSRPTTECVLQFRFEGNGVLLNDDFSCKCYCGQRASFEGVRFRSPRGGKTANHGVQRTPKSGAADAGR